MNQGDHETTTTPWEVIRNPDEQDYMEMRIISTVEGCPYDIIQIIKLTGMQMRQCPDPNLGQLRMQQEMDAGALQWDRIFHVQKLTMTQPVHDWNLEDWIKAAPFLFTNVAGKPLDEELKNDEEMQKERDTWS